MQLEIPEHEICGCGGPEELRDMLPLWRQRRNLEMVIEMSTIGIRAESRRWAIYS